MIGLRTGNPPLSGTLKRCMRLSSGSSPMSWTRKCGVELSRPHVRRVCAGAFFVRRRRDCIARGRDYYDGGARYNTDYIQCCGLGTTTDCLSAIRTHVYEKKDVTWKELLPALSSDWRGREDLRLLMTTKHPGSGTTTIGRLDRAARVPELVRAIDGRPSPGAAHTTSTFCRPPATSISASGRERAPTAGTRWRRYRTGHRPPRVPTGRVHRRDQVPLKIDIAETGALFSTSASSTDARWRKRIDSLASLIKTYFRMVDTISSSMWSTPPPSRGAEEARRLPKPPRARPGIRIIRRPRSEHQEEIISRTAQEAF